MSASPIRRSTGVLVAAVLSLALLAGCTQGQRDASNYGDTEDEFIQGCEQIANEDTDKIESGEATGEGLVAIDDPDEYCACVFQEIEDNVPFDEFKQANSEMRDEGGPLPASIIDAYASCKPGGEPEATTTTEGDGEGSTTTTEADATSTTAGDASTTTSTDGTTTTSEGTTTTEG